MVTALLQVIAAFSVIYFARVALQERAKDPGALVMASVGVVILSLFTGWPVHAAAGILLGLLFPLAFGRGKSPWPMLWALGCAVVFALTGADWVAIPAAVAAGLWVLSGSGREQLAALTGAGTLAAPRSPDALPEQTGGLTMPAAPMAEAVPVVPRVGATRAGPTAPAPAPDALSGLHFEGRLPAEARAQLVALDSVTAEALDALKRQGQSGGEALYQLRAIRAEYAPNVVQAYLRLPPTLADTAPLDGHKTGRDLLTEQLELLIGAARDILHTSAVASSQELLSNGHFLRDKFGRRESDLKF